VHVAHSAYSRYFVSGLLNCELKPSNTGFPLVSVSIDTKYCCEFILNHFPFHTKLSAALKLKLFSILNSVVGAIVSNHIVQNRPHADNAVFSLQLTL